MFSMSIIRLIIRSVPKYLHNQNSKINDHFTIKFKTSSLIFGGICIGTSVIGIFLDRNNIHAWSLPFSANKSPFKQTKDGIVEIIELSDSLYQKSSPQEIYVLLSENFHTKKESVSSTIKFEIAWRLARAALEYSSEPDLDSSFRRKLVNEALEASKLALSINPYSSVAHKWMGLSLSEMSNYEGFMFKIMNAHVIRTHFERAKDLSPSDPHIYHLIGLWCYSVANQGFFQRFTANVIFSGSPMASSFQEALIFFEDCERVKPNFLLKNHLMLAKTYKKLNNLQSSKAWLEHILSQTPKTNEDKLVIEEAEVLLKEINLDLI